MTRLRAICLLGFCLFAWPWAIQAQQLDFQVESLGESGYVQFDLVDNFYATNGVIVKYAGAVLTADSVSGNSKSGDIYADGHVRLQRDAQVWVSEHLHYNFKTRELESHRFRTGHPPVFAEGEGLHGEVSKQGVYAATNAWITTEDISQPTVRIRAKYLRLIPNERVEARNATLYVGNVPMFYFPYYSRRLAPRSNHFSFVPGYRTIFGPYLLTEYHWYLPGHDEDGILTKKQNVDGVIHADYRQRRGVGLGPDVNLHLDRWGEAEARYYYAHDEDPAISGPGIPEDRQRVYFAYQSTPFTNLQVKSMVRYQTDTNIVREFFESEYRQNPQPSTYVDFDKYYQNWSLDTYVQPRVNDFLQTVERLPEARLTGYRQQVGTTPLYYESQSSVGYYQQLFPVTNMFPSSLDYAAARADSFHQLLLPYTFFGWLNFTPRAGVRGTYYSEASGPGARTDEATRGVFNTGAEMTFKASRVWPGVSNDAFEMDGVRHIMQPGLNYQFVPTPNYRPNQLPQFDSELPSLRLLPIDFPSYNAIDSIDNESTLRLGINNKLQTKRQGQVVNVVNWDLYTDWRLEPHADQTTFSDLFSDLVLRPRHWLTLESLMRYNPDSGHFNMAFETLTFQPNDVWSWSIGNFYLRDDTSPSPTALGIGNNLFTSSMFYRLDENWGLRATHRFDARDGRLQEQDYTVYRDLRSWTVALTFRALQNTTGPTDYTVAFTFSLKAFPKFGLGQDVARPWSLLGD
jgi:LPS-assembly protein